MKALPLAFEENLGQVGNEYRFVVRRNGVETRFRDRSVEISTPSGPSGVSLVFPGASNSVRLTGEGLGTGRTNYLVGTDANKWLRNIRQFEKVRYSQLFEGIDLVFYGSDADLEHDFIVSPGADPSQISFEIENARNLRLGGDGSLKVQVTSGFLRFKKPVAYQLLGGSRKDVAANFVRRGNRISFRLGKYDRSAPLVIDPVLTFATYLDGTGKDEITAVATDAAGNIYVTGTTSSQDFPITTGAIKTSTGCTSTIYCPTLAFISKLDPTGHTLLFSTYLGGKQGASSYGVAVDGSGNVIVSGVSQSADFPLYGGFLSVGQSTSYPAHFLVSLTNDGSGFNFAGTIGHVGTFNNNGKVAVDSQGNVYLTGQTNDIYFPGTPGVVSTEFLGYPHDNTFVLKVNKTGTLVYSTAIPGTAPQDYTSNNSYIPNGIAVDADGNASIAGDAHIGLPTTPGVIGPAFPPHTGSGAGLSGFVLKLNSTASAILFATYLPGADLVKALAQDSAGN